MRFTVFVAGIIAISFLHSESEAIQLDEADFDLAQLDAIPPKKEVKKVAAPAIVKKPAVVAKPAPKVAPKKKA